MTRVSLGAVGAVVGLALGALGATASAQDRTYGVLMKTLSNPFWGAMEEGVKDGAANAGVEYYLQAVESDQAAEPQLNVCNTMLQRKPDVMITAAINSTILLPCLKAATDAGIPIVDLDANLDHDIASDAGVDISFTIGSDNEAAGAQGADYVVEVLGADATGPVLVIEGLAGNITGQRRARGFADRLAELAPGLEMVASLPGDWDRGKAANITNDIADLRIPDLKSPFSRRMTAWHWAPLKRSMPPARATRSGDGDRRRWQLRCRQVHQVRASQRPRSPSCPTWSASRRWSASPPCWTAAASRSSSTSTRWC